MLRVIMTVAMIMMCAQISFGADKIAKCEIYTGKTVDYKGKCVFMPDEPAGSFSLSSVRKDKPLYDHILVVSVTIVEKDVAEVRGLTKDGNNSRWGEAKRSEKDKACWEGSDFKVCAR